MLREEKGITLVALIITIIVLIILAAVTIMTLTNDNFIGTAINGTQSYANAQRYESSQIDALYQKFSATVSNIQSIEDSWAAKESSSEPIESGT